MARCGLLLAKMDTFRPKRRRAELDLSYGDGQVEQQTSCWCRVYLELVSAHLRAQKAGKRTKPNDELRERREIRLETKADSAGRDHFWPNRILQLALMASKFSLLEESQRATCFQVATATGATS